MSMRVVLPMLCVVVFYGGLVGGTNFSFPMFTEAAQKSFKVESEASLNSGWNSYDMTTQGYAEGRPSCGQVTYTERVQMVGKDAAGADAAASFSTAFTFSFHSAKDRNACGDGMAFTFRAAGAALLKPSDAGSGFCILDYSNRSTTHRVFAVEFDSFYNAASIEDGPVIKLSSGQPHVGVDLNNTSLATAGLCDPPAPCSAYFCGEKGSFSAWIDYDGASKQLEVRFAPNVSFHQSNRPADAVITVKDLQLDKVLEKYMYVGFVASTGGLQEIHRLQSWRFETSGLMPEDPVAPVPAPVVPAAKPESRGSTALIAGILAAVIGSTLGVIFMCIVCKRQRKRSFEKLEMSTMGLTETSWAFTYKELSRITKNFSDSELLASGGFGDVFKGTLASGSLVAVKRIKRRKEQDEKSFVAEATSMRQIRHRNLLQLQGWCISREGLFLVFDFMSNSSLDKWIYWKPKPGTELDHGDIVTTTNMETTLSWDVRRSILAGVASGLAYLHGEWVQCILHRDIKSSNVMLDADFNAYLGDFGLARLVDHHKVDKTTLLAGTLGYMAPEMQYTGRATKETDVYAFGILVLELVCGRRPLEAEVVDPKNFVLVDCVWRAHEAADLLRVADRPLTFGLDQGKPGSMGSERLLDSKPSMHGALQEKMAILDTLHLGLLCCHPFPSERPTMRQVNQWFQSSVETGAGAMELPPLPATKPRAEYHNLDMNIQLEVSDTMMRHGGGSGYVMPNEISEEGTSSSQSSTGGHDSV